MLLPMGIPVLRRVSCILSEVPENANMLDLLHKAECVSVVFLPLGLSVAPYSRLYSSCGTKYLFPWQTAVMPPTPRDMRETSTFHHPVMLT